MSNVVIGITGGIASGKSTVAKYLRSLGLHVLDADKIGHQCYESGSECMKQVVQAFGDQILTEDGLSIDRKKLGAVVFANGSRERLDTLNAIVWPHIAAKIESEVASLQAKGISPIFVEAAVMVEANWTYLFDEVWVVYTSAEKATQRLMHARSMDREAAEARINKQISNQQRFEVATETISNITTSDQLARNVQTLLQAKFDPEPTLNAPHFTESPLGILYDKQQEPLQYFYKYKAEKPVVPNQAVRAADVAMAASLACTQGAPTPTAHPQRFSNTSKLSDAAATTNTTVHPNKQTLAAHAFVEASSRATKEQLEAAAKASARENIVHIDADNKIIGSIDRAQMRKKNLWHRATYIFVRRPNGTYIVQRRTLNKDYCPGYLDVSTGGVIAAGELIIQSAYRELEEELGLKNVKLDYCFHFPYEDEHCRTWAYVFTAETDLPVTPQPEEVAEVLVLSKNDMKTIQQTGQEQFTADSLHALDLLERFECYADPEEGIDAIEDASALRSHELVEQSNFESFKLKPKSGKCPNKNSSAMQSYKEAPVDDSVDTRRRRLFKTGLTLAVVVGALAIAVSFGRQKRTARNMHR